jgi:hypothetical protein
MEMHIDIYDNNDKKQFQVWIGKKENLYEQLEMAYKNNPNMKFVPNIAQLKKNMPAPVKKIITATTTNRPSSSVNTAKPTYTKTNSKPIAQKSVSTVTS